MKKIIRKIKNWLIGKLGGYTKEEFGALSKIQIELQRKIMQAWAKTVQEICRKSNDTYYDWCCEYCDRVCDKRNGWCRRFEPKIVIKESEDDNKWE